MAAREMPYAPRTTAPSITPSSPRATQPSNCLPALILSPSPSLSLSLSLPSPSPSPSPSCARATRVCSPSPSPSPFSMVGTYTHRYVSTCMTPSPPSQRDLSLKQSCAQAYARKHFGCRVVKARCHAPRDLPYTVQAMERPQGPELNRPRSPVHCAGHGTAPGA